MLRGKPSSSGGKRSGKPSTRVLKGDGKPVDALFRGNKSLWRGFRFVRNGTGAVGVDISPGKICMVRARKSGCGFEVLAMKTVRFDRSLDLASEEALGILRAALDAFLGKGKKCGLWASVQTSSSDMQLITIPKVPKTQIDNAVFWSAKRELDFEEGKVVFDYEKRGELTEKGAAKISALVYAVPTEDVQSRVSLCAGAGHPLAGLAMPSFAAQNIFRSCGASMPPGGAAVLFVGWSWSRLEIFSAEGLVFNRVIKASMSGMEQCIYEELEERKAAESEPAPEVARVDPLSLEIEPETALDLEDEAHPAALTLDLEDDDAVVVVTEEAPEAPRPATPTPAAPAAVRAEFKDPEQSVDEGAPEEEAEGVTAKKLLFCLVPGQGNLGEQAEALGYSLDEVFKMTLPAATRLARQVEMTLKHYRETLGNDPVGKVYVTGPLSPSAHFVKFIGDSLGMPCEIFDPLGMPLAAYAGTAAAPATLTERVGYNLALGLALSDDASTPNLLNTYAGKRVKEKVDRINRSMLVGCAGVLALMAGLNVYQSGLLREKGRRLAGLEQELGSITPRVDTEILSRAAARDAQAKAAVKRFAERNQGLGALGEILFMVPENVKLLDVTLNLGRPQDLAADKMGGKPQASQVRTVVLDGVVLGDAATAESALAGYLVSLRSSPLFVESAVTKNERETLSGTGEEVLRVVASLVLAEL